MTTHTWRAGSADPLVFQPVEPDGTLTSLTGLSMQLRVSAGDQCILLDGVATLTGDPTQDGFDIDLAPLSALTPRAYRASVYYDDGSGWRCVEDITLVIEGGC